MAAKSKDIVGIADLKESGGMPFLAALLAEFLGTLFIILLGCGSALNFVTSTDLVQISLTFGLVVFAGVVITGPISGANLNPAVTVGLLAAGRVKLIRAILYIIVQCLGGIVGGYILYGLTPPGLRGTLGSNALFCQPYDGGCVTQLQGIGVELLTVFMLVIVVLAITDCKRESKLDPSLAVGLTVTLCHLFAIPYTGCGLNPARSLGPAVAAGSFDGDHYVYWVGPMAGALLAPAVYHIVYFRFHRE